jgi:hypothetical protein
VESQFTKVLVERGGVLTLSVGLSEASPAAECQWFHNDEPVAWATNTSLTLSNAQAEDAGAYWVIASNAIDEVVQTVGWVEVQEDLGALVQNDFGTDAEGWSWGTGTQGLGPPDTGWNAGGCLEVAAHQTGEAWWWAASSWYLGNKAFAYGGALQFDLKRSVGTTTIYQPYVVLHGTNLSLRLACAVPAGTNWSSYRVPLREGQSWQGEDGLPALREDFLEVLGNVTALQIEGLFGSASESYALDNVAFLAPCLDEPPQLKVRLEPEASALVLEWPATAACYQLEWADTHDLTTWTRVSGVTPTLSNAWQSVRMDFSGRQRVFRLRKQ